MKATALRSQIAMLTASQTSADLLDTWTTASRSLLATETEEEARPMIIARDAMEAELIRRGMTADQFSALFLALAR